MNIKGTVALITGGASGLGRATAEALISRGARAIIFDLPTSAGEQAASGMGARFVAGDVTSEEDVNRALDAAAGLRIAVSCAGIGTPGRIVGKDGPMPLDRYRRVIEVNLIGTFNVMRLAAARMAAQDPDGEERGVIVNTASIAAYEGQIGQAAYASSKGGVVALTITAARDLASSLIRVCTIAPGTFDTPLLAGLDDRFRETLAAAIPHPRRLGLPEEYGRLVCSIVENPMLNGETIRLDGALRMAPR